MNDLVGMLTKIFDEIAETHFARLRATLSNDPGSDWVRSVLHRVSNKERWPICSLAAEKMAQSLSDGEGHSLSLQHDDLSVSISTFPVLFEEARRRYYPDGYIEYIARTVTVARQTNPGCHWLHYQFLADGKMCYVQFTLFPNDKVLDFPVKSQFPTELLNREEKARLGLK